MRFLILLSLLSFALNAWSKQHVMISPIGASPKGQFVALEESGYQPRTQKYFVRLKVINVWKDEVVGEEYEVEARAHSPEVLIQLRKEAIIRASEQLRKYQIST